MRSFEKGQIDVRLAECLSNASVKTLRLILKEQNLHSSMHSKHDMLQTILYEMRVPSHMASQCEKWYQEWGSILIRIALSARSRFSSEEISALFFASGRQQDHVEQALTQGWLFARREVSMRPEYIVPDDIHDLLRAHAMAVIRSNVLEREDAPLIQRDEGEAMARDLNTLLEYVENNEIQITTEGAMYKRHLQRVMELFEISEDLAVPKWRFGYGRRTNDYPDRLALLYDFAYHEGLLVETNQAYLQVGESVSEWRKKSRRWQLQQLLSFYLTVYRKPIPRLREIVEVIRVFSDRWVSSLSLLDAFGDLVASFYYDNRHAVWETRIVNMFAHLGMIRVGQDEKVTEHWFQMTELGQQLLAGDSLELADAHQPKRACLIVQPNFEMMVTVQDSRLEMLLTQFSELKSSGSLRIYRLLERTVMDGLASGHDLDSWLRKVNEISFGPVPGNVERTLREWQARTIGGQQKPLSS